MKKILIFLVSILILSQFVLAWDTCDEGCDSSSPECGQYIDTNQNNLCDHSEPIPTTSATTQKIELSVPVITPEEINGQEIKLLTVQEVSNMYNINEEYYAQKLANYLGTTVSPNHKIQTLHDNYDLEPSIVKEIALEIQSESIQPQEVKTARNYFLIPILLITLLLYSLTLYPIQNPRLFPTHEP